MLVPAVIDDSTVYAKHTQHAAQLQILLSGANSMYLSYISDVPLIEIRTVLVRIYLRCSSIVTPQRPRSSGRSFLHGSTPHRAWPH